MDEQLVKTLIEEAHGEEPTVRVVLMALVLLLLAVRWFLDARSKRSAPTSCRYTEPPDLKALTRTVERIADRLSHIERELQDCSAAHSKIVDKIDELDKRTIELRGYVRRRTGER